MLSFPIAPPALRWLESILAERFGHSWRLARIEEGLQLTMVEADGAIVFDSLCDGFTQAGSDLSFTQWDAAGEGWESVLGEPLPAPGFAELASPLIDQRKGKANIHYDILGLAYWMMARVEEIGRTDLDSHARFPATSSHAFKHNYLERPVVDEWLHVLGQVMQHTWPGFALKRNTFSMMVSHDVDAPSRYGFRSWPEIARRMAGDILKRRDVGAAIRVPWVKHRTSQCLHAADPANTFEWIMDVSERHGLTSAFYFICGRTSPQHDADYELGHPAIRTLMRRIHERGHEIGLHPSYNTYKTPAAICAEANRLWAVAETEGIQQAKWGGRMHYLRWEQPITMRAWDEAEMCYDSTLSYADRPGFRCGTCFEYNAYDAEACKKLRLRIRPLTAMECTVMANRYMGLGSGQAAYAKFKKLKDVCRAVSGNFTLLWHNTELENSEYRLLYESIVND